MTGSSAVAPSGSRGVPSGDDVYRAYAAISPDHTLRVAELEAALDRLLDVARRAESALVREMKPTIAVALKWKFDYLAKSRASPFELEADVAYWTGVLHTLVDLGQRGWFDLTPGAAPPKDVWKRTAEGFDIGWTTTTEGERFAASREIAEDRLEQILDMLGGAGSIRGKSILDSGCGPGRYIDVLLRSSPHLIVGMDQGKRLMEALRARFSSEEQVRIVRATCERLPFADGSFDFVLSNGVLHHTPSDILTMIRDHARVLRSGGALFIMLVGRGGLELKIWEFLRAFLFDVPIEEILRRFAHKISPLRLQGIADHMYGEYQQTDRDRLEQWCSELFEQTIRVPGVPGLDVTPEAFADDPYFTARFGSGHLRYLCVK